MLDNRFRYIYSGRVAELLAHWNMPRSPALHALLSALLCPPEQRLSCEDALRHAWFQQQ